MNRKLYGWCLLMVLIVEILLIILLLNDNRGSVIVDYI